MRKLKISDWIKIIAGSLVFFTAAFGMWVNQYWLYFTMFVGLNLFQFGITGFCPMSWILRKFGVKE